MCWFCGDVKSGPWPTLSQGSWQHPVAPSRRNVRAVHRHWPVLNVVRALPRHERAVTIRRRAWVVAVNAPQRWPMHPTNALLLFSRHNLRDTGLRLTAGHTQSNCTANHRSECVYYVYYTPLVFYVCRDTLDIYWIPCMTVPNVFYHIPHWNTCTYNVLTS